MGKENSKTQFLNRSKDMDMVKIQTENVESDVQEKYKSTIFKNRILQKFEPNSENILLVLGMFQNATALPRK